MSAVPHLRVVHNIDATTGELVGCPHCAAAHEEAELWEQEVLKLKRQVKQALEDKDAKLRNDQHFGAASDLFDEWKTETNHPRARFDNARIRLAMAAVKLYGKDDRDKLSMVVQYGKHLAYVDERGTRHDSFGLLFRDAEHIEKYANAYHRWARQNGVA